MITLQVFQQSHMHKLIEWIDSPEFLLQWGGPIFTYPLNEKQLERYMEEPDRYIYSVAEQETGEVIGHISLGRIDRANRSARVGKVLVGEPSARGKGIGERMMRDILAIAFDDMKLHRVSLGVFSFNEPAIACYEKVGFKRDGLLRDLRKMGDDYWSLWEMSMLEDEWGENRFSEL
ncbi:GNAT family N-acetyltransferase [Salicibibacter cibarius]|uniref:GNAT family N-acetyltransferase n=1 Tax=Salicibibacter cibarius TaxID=2743000 RepID=A0A7T6Z1N8_9BACI|nr:GNAT family protein [Salicibibacter cibarius]QQK75340.1 GNAT family N-acetyltransferase [Salicibibacter cibarius]